MAGRHQKHVAGDALDRELWPRSAVEPVLYACLCLDAKRRRDEPSVAIVCSDVLD